jgi:hypothetical protein
MDEEFPKTVNSALLIAGKVHGSITDLVKTLGDLQADLAGLAPAMNQALSIIKSLPPNPTPSPLPVPLPVAPAPVTAAKPAVSEGTKASAAAEAMADKPPTETKFKPHSSTPA